MTKMNNTFVENSEKLSDSVLVEKINSGEYDLLREIISRYTPVVQYYAKGLALNDSDVEDLVQDGLIALYSAVKGYVPDKASFSTFASLCIKRAMIGENRAAVRKKRVPVELCDSLDETPELAGVKSAENEFIEKENLKTLTDSIRLELSEFEYKVLSAFLSGSSYSAIAEECEVSVKAVDNALKRIRAKLKNRTK